MPEDLPDDPVLLKQLLAQLLTERTVDKGQIVDLKEQIKLLRDRLFSRKSEQTVEPNTPQLALFNEPENLSIPQVDDNEEVVAPILRRGKRKPLSADLPRIVAAPRTGAAAPCAVCGRLCSAVAVELLTGNATVNDGLTLRQVGFMDRLRLIIWWSREDLNSRPSKHIDRWLNGRRTCQVGYILLSKRTRSISYGSTANPRRV